CAGTHLDSAQPVRRPGPQEDPRVRQEHSDGSARTTQRGRSVVPVPGLRRFELHDWAGPPSRRRGYHVELTGCGRYNCHACPFPDTLPNRWVSKVGKFHQLAARLTSQFHDPYDISTEI